MGQTLGFVPRRFTPFPSRPAEARARSHWSRAGPPSRQGVIGVTMQPDARQRRFAGLRVTPLASGAVPRPSNTIHAPTSLAASVQARVRLVPRKFICMRGQLVAPGPNSFLTGDGSQHSGEHSPTARRVRSSPRAIVATKLTTGRHLRRDRGTPEAIQRCQKAAVEWHFAFEVLLKRRKKCKLAPRTTVRRPDLANRPRTRGMPARSARTIFGEIERTFPGYGRA